MKRLAALLPILILTAATARAGIPSQFFAVRDELVQRHGVLSNSTDKVEQKQDKAVVKGINLINNVTDLADDIKLSYKLGSLLAKTFPNEFEPLVSAVFSNNILSLVLDGYDNIGGELDDILDDLADSIGTLPEGKDRDKAEDAFNDAVSALNDAGDAFEDGNYKATTKFFGSCLKSAQKAQKIINKASSE